MVQKQERAMLSPSVGCVHSLSFLNHDYTEADEKDELKCFSSVSV